MASTHTKNLARAIQRANPGMKYTEALRHAEAGRIVVDPKGSPEAIAGLYQAVGMPVAPLDLSASVGSWPLDALRVARGDEDRPLATVHAPQDPLPLLWDGETHADPLTFLIGQGLESKEKRYLTLDGTDSHIMIAGGTATGKSNLAEIIAAQALMKSMPWDPDLHGSVVLVDPSGALARRWSGRPGVVVANAQEEESMSDESGYPNMPAVMASTMEWVEAEHQRRAAILARYANVETWLDLPNEVKRAERFAPMVVVLDEYAEHAPVDSLLVDEHAAKKNAARETIIRLATWHARKYSIVGMHTVLIAQSVSNPAINATLMRNLPVRVMTGRAAISQLRTMFGSRDIPGLHSPHASNKNGEWSTPMSRGRARVMTQTGRIEAVQIPWFGGSTNMETLDKWLPRGKASLGGHFTPSV